MTFSFTIEAWPVVACVVAIMVIAPLIQYFLRRKKDNGGE